MSSPFNNHVESVSSRHNRFLSLVNHHNLYQVIIRDFSYLIMGHVEHLLTSDRVEEIIGLETNIGSQAVGGDLSWKRRIKLLQNI